MGAHIDCARLAQYYLDNTEVREHLHPKGGAVRRLRHKDRVSRRPCSPAALIGANW